jgi:hypothetical protein
MRSDFLPGEKLYRKIRPLEQFWDCERGRPTSGAFKDSKGLSVDRDGDRSEPEVISAIDERLPLDGFIVSVKYAQCQSIPTDVVYLPVQGNEYHSEIHDSVGRIPLSASKAKRLSEMVYIVKNPADSDL